MNMNNRMTGTILLVIGAAILLFRFMGIGFWDVAWPMWIIAPGLAFLYFAFAGEWANVGFAIPGAVVTGTGLILATLNLTGRWEAWAYLWTLYPAFVGLAMNQVGRRNDDNGLQEAGRRVGIIGLYMLVGFGLFFELMIFGGGFGIFNSTFLPLLLITGGAYFMFGRGCVNIMPEEKSKKRKVDVY
jgi:hypothetical protein